MGILMTGGAGFMDATVVEYSLAHGDEVPVVGGPDAAGTGNLADLRGVRAPLAVR